MRERELFSIFPTTLEILHCIVAIQTKCFEWLQAYDKLHLQLDFPAFSTSPMGHEMWRAQASREYVVEAIIRLFQVANSEKIQPQLFTTSIHNSLQS